MTAMENTSEPPLLCRTAMLELELSHDAMAELLDIDASRVLQMCILGEHLPAKLARRVRILLNTHRRYWQENPVLDTVRDLLRFLNLHGGAVQLDRVRQDFAISGRQLKSVELNEGWITLVWEQTGRRPEDGRHVVIYLTAKGYKELGLIMPDKAPLPPLNARPLEAKDHNEVQQMLLDHFEQEIAAYRERIDNIESMRMLVIHGLMPVGAVVDMYRELTDHQSETRLIQDATK